MRSNLVSWALYSVKTREAKIDPQPPRQRGPVWSPRQKELLIDSILRNYDIPKLYLSRVNKPPYEYEVIDGQQRLRAIWEFFRDEFPLSDDADPVNGHTLSGQIYSQLDDELHDIFEGYSLHFVVFEGASSDEMDDMFLRLNEGTPLNSAEKRNAISGKMRNFVNELASTHDFFTKSIGFENKRYLHDELAAQMTLAELNSGPTSAQHRQLKNMYETHKKFKTDSPKAHKIIKVLNFMRKAFPNKTPELTKAATFSLYILASYLLEKYAISTNHREFGQWFLDFEARRRQDEQLDSDSRDPDLIQYQLYLTQGTANQTGIQHRHRVLASDLLLFIPNLKLLDDQRIFDENQRIAIFRKFNGKCVNPDKNPDCEVACEWDNFHADHIVPWSAGGKTTVSNGQLLCANCNQKKGATR